MGDVSDRIDCAEVNDDLKDNLKNEAWVDIGFSLNFPLRSLDLLSMYIPQLVFFRNRTRF